MRKILLAIVIAVTAVLGVGCSSRGSGGEGGGAGKPGAGSSQSLQEFCGDAELNAWFDSITENPPVKMTYIIFGEGPISMEFTDPELILQTVRALQTVRIGEKSAENPDNVMDAGGDGYYFEMADGKHYSFSFVLGCFRWKKGEYHHVYSYGDLPEVSEELARIGNPQFIYAYAEDDGFYIKHLETYRSSWKAEDGYGGGLFVYLGEEDKAPYVSVCRCLRQPGKGQAGAEENMSAMEFLTTELAEQVMGEIESSGAVAADISEAQEYTFDRKTLPGIVYTVLPQKDKTAAEAGEGITEAQVSEEAEAAGGMTEPQVSEEAEAAGGMTQPPVSGEAEAAGGMTAAPAGEEDEASVQEESPVEMMVLVLKKEDQLLQKPAFIRFTAAYHTSNPDEEAKVMAALTAALRDFSFSYMPYEKKDVKPGSLLLDFCGDARLREWMDHIEEHFPDELFYRDDESYYISDPEMIRRALEALRTVRIGEKSKVVVGASDMRAFDFIRNETGEGQSFYFFADNFEWDGTNYEVVDWGELKDLIPALRKAAQ